MVDLILFAALLGAFLGGVYCGRKFGSLRAMFTRVKAALSRPDHPTRQDDPQ